MMGEKALFRQGDYTVCTGELKNGDLGYYVVNEEHGIVEHETCLLFDAMKWCRICDANVKELSQEPPEQLSLWPPQPSNTQAPA